MSKIIISNHAKQQMLERGATEQEVRLAILKGEPEPARKTRIMYKKNFQFNNTWREKEYKIKQVAPIVKKENSNLIVVTVCILFLRSKKYET